MKNWKVEITARGKSLTELKIQRGIFQRDALSPLLFVIAIMPLNHILRRCTGGYKLIKSLEKINYQMYFVDIKLFAKNEIELATLINAVRIYSQDLGMVFGIEKCAMLMMKSGRRHRTEGIELPIKTKCLWIYFGNVHDFLIIYILDIADIESVNPSGFF